MYKRQDSEKTVNEKSQELEDAKKELESGKSKAAEELEKAKQQLTDGEAELADAKQQIADGETQLADAKAQLNDKPVSYTHLDVYKRQLTWLAEQFGKDVKIVRTMPNTPAMVGEGMTAATPNEHVTKEELDYACKILSAFGKVEVVTEYMMDAVVAVSGSSPAYVFMFIEAMADAAVAEMWIRDSIHTFCNFTKSCICAVKMW